VIFLDVVRNIFSNVTEQPERSIAALQMYFVYIVQEGRAHVPIWGRHKAKEEGNLFSECA